jgi:hypothetical protein
MCDAYVYRAGPAFTRQVNQLMDDEKKMANPPYSNMLRVFKTET